MIPTKMSMDDFNKTVDFFNRQFDLGTNIKDLQVEYSIQKFNYEPSAYRYIFALVLSYSRFFEEFLLQMQIENDKNQKHYFIRNVFDINDPEVIFRHLFCDYVQIVFFSNSRYKLSNYRKVLFAYVSDFIDYVIEDHTAKLAKESILYDEDDEK